jgi:hypothetical protein
MMINRRNILLLLGYLGFGALSQNTRLSEVHASELSLSKAGDELPPHFEALSLIWNTQKEQIKALELEHAKKEQSKSKEYVSADSRWWFDTDERRWAIERLFSPGNIDSRHMFLCTYIIKGKKLITWRVDTKQKYVVVASS